MQDNGEDDTNHRRVSDESELKASIATLLSRVVQVGEQRFIAPGPDEARAFLQLVDLAGTDVHSKCAKPRAIYRGMADSTWSLKPTLLRAPAERHAVEAQASKLFADIVQSEFEGLLRADTIVDWPPIDSESGQAAAQHYGMSTSLLDWSSSCGVAMHFATKDFAKNREHSSVWWLHLSATVCEHIRLILPPPFIENLYLQRGLFAQVPDERTAELLERLAWRIDFPARSHSEVTAVDPSGRLLRILDCLEETPCWFQILRSYCYSEEGQLFASHESSPAGRALHYSAYLQRICPELRKPWDYVIRDMGVATSLGNDGILDKVSRHIFSLMNRYGKDVKYLDENIAALLKRDNPKVLEWVLSRKAD